MAITMTNYALTWTDPQGNRHGSAVGYDEASAQDEQSSASRRLAAPTSSSIR
ncbi:hypothetical protein ACWGH2_24690 [Streptomyces sp. NPDC054871]